MLLDQLAPTMSPFVRLEVGRARVVPHVVRSLSSFVHDHLAREGMLTDYQDNRAAAVRCVHPLVTLFEKLDAMSRRYGREAMEPDGFVRHYEDAAQIIRAIDELPEMEMTAADLAADLVAKKDVAALPTHDEPALLLADANKRAQIRRAYDQIAPMFWGSRIPLVEACRIVRDWLESVGFGQRVKGRDQPS
jgi:hypothetical protein